MTIRSMRQALKLMDGGTNPIILAEWTGDLYEISVRTWYPEDSSWWDKLYNVPVKVFEKLLDNEYIKETLHDVGCTEWKPTVAHVGHLTHFA